jgi:hypothetical protein
MPGKSVENITLGDTYKTQLSLRKHYFTLLNRAVKELGCFS